jgi:hypothetical protein
MNKLHANMFNRRGNFPKLEKKPPLLKIADPQNLKSDVPAIKAAAEIKQAEDLAPQKIKAIKYLAQIGCGCYDKDEKITKALLAAMEDCTEAVRVEAVRAISLAAAGEMCSQCKQKSCCNEKIAEQLYKIAYELDDLGCPLEPSERVREAAIEALNICCPNRLPVSPTPVEQPVEGVTVPQPVEGTQPGATAPPPPPDSANRWPPALSDPNSSLPEGQAQAPSAGSPAAVAVETRVTNEREAPEREAQQRQAADLAWEQERKLQELLDAERQAAERQAAERQSAERQVAERQTAERQAAERQAAERQAAERQAAEREVAERQAAESRAAEQRLAAERQAAERQAAETQLAERQRAEQEAAEKEAAAHREGTSSRRLADSRRRTPAPVAPEPPPTTPPTAGQPQEQSPAQSPRQVEIPGTAPIKSEPSSRRTARMKAASHASEGASAQPATGPAGAVAMVDPRRNLAHVHFSREAESVAVGSRWRVYDPAVSAQHAIGEVEVTEAFPGSATVRALGNLNLARLGKGAVVAPSR